MPNALSNEEKIKKTIFELNQESSCGPNGLNSHFYQVLQDIVGGDIIEVIHDFFGGSTLPKSIFHTNLVLIPKKDVIQEFYDLRPISLSNFLNKVISRIIHGRMEN